MKKILIPIIMLCIAVFAVFSAYAETLPPGNYQYQELEGSQVCIAHLPDAGLSYVVDFSDNIYAGPYTFISDFSSFAYAEMDDGSSVLYDHDGSVLIEADAQHSICPPDNGIYGIETVTEAETGYESDDYRMTLYDYDTRQELCTLSHPVYFWIEQQTDKMVIKKEGKCAFINKYGELQSDYVYDEVKQRFNPDYVPYPKAYAIVVQDGVEKYIDWDLNEIDFDNTDGEPFITNFFPVWESDNTESERYRVLESGKKIGLYDKIDDRLIIPFQDEYDMFLSVSDNLVIVRNGELCGITDFDRNIILPVEYSDINPVGGGLFLCYRVTDIDENNIYSYEWRIVNKDGKTVFVTDKNISGVDNGLILLNYAVPDYTYEYAHNYTDYICYEIVNFAGHNINGEIYARSYFKDGRIYVTNDFKTSLPDYRELNIERNFAVICLNGGYLPFDGEIQSGRTLVPMREIIEGLGGSVEWNGETQSVYAVIDGKEIALSIGSDIMSVDGIDEVLDVPAQIINNKTMLPLRAVAEAAGAQVDWDEQIRCVYINR